MEGTDESTLFRQNVKEAIKKLEESFMHLNSEVQNVNSSIGSVKTSSANAKKTVEQYFTDAKQQIITALETRMAYLLTTINEIETKDLIPLNDLIRQLDNDTENTKSLITEGYNILEEEDELVIPKSKEIYTKLQQEQKSYSDTPCVAQNLSVTFDDNSIDMIIDSCERLGEITMLGSLQIIDLVEQAGAILVQWDETLIDSESVTDSSCNTQEYMLQYCKADNKDDNLFSTIYQGEQMSYVVTDIEPRVTYMFRVSGRSCNKEKWGPWSMCKNGLTSLEPHEWSKQDCINEKNITIYQLSNDRRTATKVFPESSKLLRSCSMSYILGNVLTFTIEETGESSTCDVIGLITQRYVVDNKQMLHGPECVGITSTGVVHVNGVNMVTRLPQFKRGTQISFEANQLSPTKLRVSVSVDNKEVTLDWSIIQETEKLYFAMCFGQTGWQVTIG